ncbi:helix-turn-helix domain-containing protein [Niveispirillum sp. KHB5.9]|uniref:helix-turn-helix domain-containing protein n=1 Tax=Niveispirillum sp. KHB5.9 TaxID=3400269 RepID=UPI003A87CC84
MTRAGKKSAATAAPVDANVIASSIHATRRRKGMTLADLAERTDMDKGYLSRVERGQKSPSVGTLLKIADALGVPVGHLFGENTDDNAVTVIRRTDHVEIADDGAEGPGALVRALLPASGKRRLSVFMIEPGSDRLSQKADHPGDEFLYVLEGSLEIIFPDRVVQLDTGDAIHFDGHLRHQLRRVGEAPARALVAVAQDLTLRGGEE